MSAHSPLTANPRHFGGKIALYGNSTVIILDEATASVDVETEQQIREAIAGVAGNRTIIAIAHRLSTIRNADQILVIEDGRITERGTHKELIALGGSYARMNSIQAHEIESDPVSETTRSKKEENR